jgi:tetratricopeptide (TPR) repeat protein
MKRFRRSSDPGRDADREASEAGRRRWDDQPEASGRKPFAQRLRSALLSRTGILAILALIAFGLALQTGQIELPRFAARTPIPAPLTGDLDLPEARLMMSYRKAVEEDRDSFDAWLEYGYLLDAVGKNEEAIQAYLAASELEPSDIRPLYGLGYLYRIVGRIDESIEIYRGLTAELPNYPPVFVRYGEALDFAGRTEEAVVAYRRAVELEEGFAQAQRQLGQALLTLNDVDGAIEHLERARALQDRDRATYLALSRAYQIKGDSALAAELGEAAADMKALLASRDSFRQPVTRLRPGYRLAYIKAQSALQARSYFNALEPLLEVASVWPEERWVHLGLVLAYEAHGDAVGAQRHRQIAEFLDQRRSGTSAPVAPEGSVEGAP